MKQQTCYHECVDCCGTGLTACDDHDGCGHDESCELCKEEAIECSYCWDGNVVWEPFLRLNLDDGYTCVECGAYDKETVNLGGDGPAKRLCEACYIKWHNSWHRNNPELKWEEK